MVPRLTAGLRMNKFFGSAGLTLLVGLAALQMAGSSFGESITDSAANERYAKIAREVTQLFRERHYRRAVIDNRLSAAVFDKYLDMLDPNRRYLSGKDLESLSRFRLRLDEAVASGNVEPAFRIFEVYRDRATARLKYALGLLDEEPDFTVDESFRFDRDGLPWPADEAELNELWRKIVKNDALSLVMTEKSWDETTEVLTKRYNRVAKRLEQITNDDIFESFMNAYADTLDPHSNYLSPRNSEEFRIQMSLSYEGIGASLQTEDDYVKVMNIIPGGPAAAVGDPKPNDRIVGVGQGPDGEWIDVIGWRLDDVVQLIRGPGGTVVRLQLLPQSAAPGDKAKVVALTRGKIQLEQQAAKSEVIPVQSGAEALRIGVITIPSFYRDFEAYARGDKDFRSTTSDVRKLIADLDKEGIDGLVIDLRNNGGGNLSEATALTGLFIEKGPLVQLRDASGGIEILNDPSPDLAFDGPLAVLVNRFSASASEIFAGAIQDYQRGLVIGQQTFGKGTFQHLYDLDRSALFGRFSRRTGPGFGQLTLTTGKYYRVSGESTQHRGVEPDILLPSAIDAAEVGESTENTALPWDRIQPTRYRAANSMDEAVSKLQEQHQKRTMQNPDFQYLLAGIDAYSAIRGRHTVSLNIEKRSAERETEREAQLARYNARRKALGLSLIESLDDLDEDDEPDPQLDAAASIIADVAARNRIAGAQPVAVYNRS